MVKALEVNGRPAYRRYDDEEEEEEFDYDDPHSKGWMLWSSPGALWLIGLRRDIGKARGAVSVADGAPLPENIVAIWRTFDGRRWVDAPHLRAYSSAEALVARLGASPSLYLV